MPLHLVYRTYGSAMIESVNGTTVSCEIQGEGTSRVILLHGWGCDQNMMQPVADALKDDHQVLLVDFPGHGKSGRPPEPWGVPEFADLLRLLLETLDFIPCAAVGHSFGCRVAAWAASEWPDIFTKLVFTGAAGLKKPQTKEGRRKAKAFQRGKRIVQRIEKLPLMEKVGKQMEKGLRRKYGSADYNLLDDEMRKTFVKIISLDLEDRYPAIRQSTLLIWGDEDTETPLWMGQKMEKIIPDAGLVILENGSHFAYLEQMVRFNMIVKHFLTEA